MSTHVRKTVYESVREKFLDGKEVNRMPLMTKLCLIIDYLWEMKPLYQERHSSQEIGELKAKLMSFTFKLSPMSRYWIPKPNKPGKMRAITQPNQRDIIVMESLSVLLNRIYGEIFMSYSHGFRPGRGAITFFSQVKGWGPVERLCKVDIVGCFDNLDHGLLKGEIRAYIGEENEPIINLLGAFLTTQIVDKEGKEYSNVTKGIPQGSPLSPVMMNIFLHQLDKRINSFMRVEGHMGYVRYADDLIIAFQSDVELEGRFRRFWTNMRKALLDLKLEMTLCELTRGTRRKIRVLGLVVAIRRNGSLEIRAPLKRWRKRLTRQYVITKMGNKEKNLTNFIRTVISVFPLFIAMSFACSFHTRQQDIIRYFQDLFRTRVREFVQAFGIKDPSLNRVMGVHLSRIPGLVRMYHKKLILKGRHFLEEDKGKKEGP